MRPLRDVCLSDNNVNPAARATVLSSCRLSPVTFSLTKDPVPKGHPRNIHRPPIGEQARLNFLCLPAPSSKKFAGRQAHKLDGNPTLAVLDAKKFKSFLSAADDLPAWPVGKGVGHPNRNSP